MAPGAKPEQSSDAACWASDDGKGAAGTGVSKVAPRADAEDAFELDLAVSTRRPSRMARSGGRGGVRDTAADDDDDDDVGCVTTTVSTSMRRQQHSQQHKPRCGSTLELD